jgi:DNA-binding MarR family transcriptional regulator
MKKPQTTPTGKIGAGRADGAAVSDATLRQFIGYHMKRAFNVVQSDLAHTLKPFDLRMLTYTALVLIVDNPGLRQSQLADAMDVERPTLVVILDELERRELITRDRVATDRRAYALQVTLSGRHLYDRAVAAVTAHEEQLLQGLDAKSRDSLVAALKIIENSRGKA